MKEWRKYVSFHQRGLSNVGHFEETTNLQTGVRNEVDKYKQDGCDDDDDHDGFAPDYERITHLIQAPVPQPAVREKPSSNRRTTFRIPRPTPAQINAIGAAASTLLLIAVRVILIL